MILKVLNSKIIRGHFAEKKLKFRSSVKIAMIITVKAINISLQSLRNKCGGRPMKQSSRHRF